ncbi:hypothetical protein U1Q18_041428 [Sarracenia purpurea var. burkii]
MLQQSIHICVYATLSNLPDEESTKSYCGDGTQQNSSSNQSEALHSLFHFSTVLSMANAAARQRFPGFRPPELGAP